jgi:hypothetical protein
MSDWTSGFQAFQQGMGMLADANERKRRQKLEEERTGYEKERVGFERDRAKREGDRAALDNALLGLKRNAITKSVTSPGAVAPAGMRAKGGTPNEYGGTDYSYERLPEDLKVIEVGGRKVLYNPNTGAGEEMKPNYLDMFMGKQAPDVTPPPLPSPDAALEGPAPAGMPAIEAPQPSVGAPAGIPPSAATRAPEGGAAPRFRLGSISASGPTLEPVYPITKPELVNMPLPNGGTGMFMRTIDPKTSEEKLTPYNQPESANKISEKVVTLQNLNAARRYAKELQTAIGRSGTWESRFGNTDDAATLNQNPYLMAIAMAKVLDPGSVAREGEVNAAKKFLVPLGMTESGEVSLKSIDKLLNDLNTRAKDLGLETPEAQAAAPGQAESEGPARVSSQEQYQALPSGSTYIDGSGKLKRKP